MTTPAAPVVEIERHLHWRALALGGFLLLMLLLAVMAAVSLLVPARPVTGLPADADVQAVARTLQGRLPVPAGTLRFRSTLAGEAPAGGVLDTDAARLAERAAATLEGARARHRGDARLEIALAHLDLARQRTREAERRYRAVTDRGVDAPEARLGLGVTLALEARAERDLLRAQALRLEALAQFVAVRPDDPVYEVALYDRAVLLEGMGRHAEALRVARAYLERDPDGPWATRLRRELAITAD